MLTKPKTKPKKGLNWMFKVNINFYLSKENSIITVIKENIFVQKP